MKLNLFAKLALAGIAFTTLLLLIGHLSSIETTPKTLPPTEKVIQQAELIAEPTIDIVKIKPRTILIPSNVNRITFNTQVSEMSIRPLLLAIAVSNATNTPLLIRLDSPGGSVSAGLKVIAAIEASNVPIYALNLGLCASMCAMIFESAHKRYVTNYSVLMFHPASGGLQGTTFEMQSQLDYISKVVKKLDGAIAKRIGMDYSKWEALVVKNQWLEADEAIRLKLADGYMQDTAGIVTESLLPQEGVPESSVAIPNWTM